MRTRVLVTGFVLSLVALSAACSLNPQPEPPGSSSDVTSGPTGAGGSAATGKGGSQNKAGAAGGTSAGGSGTGGDAKGTGGGTAGSFPGAGGAAGKGNAGAAGKGNAAGAGGAASGTGGAGIGTGGSGPGTGAGGAAAGGKGGMSNGGGAGTGGGTAGAAGVSAGGGGGSTADSPIASLAPSISPACKQCLQSMTGAPAANASLDCGGVVAACGPQDQGCSAAVTCVADALALHPSAKLDCAVAKCTTPIAGEPAANDFLSCLADKCGAPCDATVGFADTSMCPP